MKNTTRNAIICAIAAAGLYAISTPFSKILLNYIPPYYMAAFLYLGAGIGIGIICLFSKRTDKHKPLTKEKLPFIFAMIILDIMAPIFMMLGLKTSQAANVSLLNNFEIVATSLIALIIFREKISKKLWIAIVLICISGVLLSVEDISAFSFSTGSIFVLLACLCWGFENNCTRCLSQNDPKKIVLIKGIFSGVGALIIAAISREKILSWHMCVLALALGFLAYGLSIYFYIYSQRHLGAAKTSAFYALAPFMSVAISLVLFAQIPSAQLILAFLIMSVAIYLTVAGDFA